jgi:hypothetical protein
MSYAYWKCHSISTTSCVSLNVTLIKSLLTIVDKSKLVIIKLKKLYVVLPFSMAKIEVRVRNVMINQRRQMEGIERFIDFYLRQMTIHQKEA